MNYGGHFEVDNKLSEIEELEKETLKPDFWKDKNRTDEIINKMNELKTITNSIKELKNNINDDIEMLEIVNDSESLSQIEKDLGIIESNLESIRIKGLLSGEYDDYNCILEVHSGAGGTEACDWAEMLYRMYSRYCESHNYKYKVLDIVYGDEAGIKTVVLSITGSFAYGYLKCEKGVHRLVRLSPFDSNHRRHTSFASVDVIPEIKNDINIEIDPNDIRIDVYRASGHGGQGVNTTPSAVRITHFPSGIVVTCQNERSQIQNKAEAMMVLKSKLKLLEETKEKENLDQIRGEQMDINFGSQIRSYVLHPYSLIKDHRTNLENTNVDRVLDGDIDNFINEYLKISNNV